MHVNNLSILWLIFCWHQEKKQKMSHLWHFNDHNSRCKRDNKTNDPIFSIYSLSCICWYILFLHFKTFKIQFHGIPPHVAFCSSLKNTHLHANDDTFKSVNILQKVCWLLLYNMFCSQFPMFWGHGLSTLKKVLGHFPPPPPI